MKWQSDEMIQAHEYSNNNKPYLKEDKVCGCFDCCKIFSPDEIEEYIEEDNDCDREGTAICPYCGIDSVIGEGSGFPITEDFLKRMNRYWMQSGSGIALASPFGEIRMQLDGIDQCFDFRCIDPCHLYTDVDAVYRMQYDYVSDGKEHLLRFILVDSPVKGDPETGERLEATSFYVKDGKITLGCTASFGDYLDYDYDFDGSLLKDGIEIFIFPTTKSQTFDFGVSWLLKCTEENDVQTWFGADPFV